MDEIKNRLVALEPENRAYTTIHTKIHLHYISKQHAHLFMHKIRYLNFQHSITLTYTNTTTSTFTRAAYLSPGRDMINRKKWCNVLIHIIEKWIKCKLVPLSKVPWNIELIKECERPEILPWVLFCFVFCRFGLKESICFSFFLWFAIMFCFVCRTLEQSPENIAPFFVSICWFM